MGDGARKADTDSKTVSKTYPELSRDVKPIRTDIKFVDIPNLDFRVVCSSDSEIRTHDGALQDDFSEQNRSWDDSGTITSET